MLRSKVRNHPKVLYSRTTKVLYSRTKIDVRARLRTLVSHFAASEVERTFVAYASKTVSRARAAGDDSLVAAITNGANP